ncbi:hypothetical protein RUND412_001401 [Rhizina undulata]
MFPNSLRQNFFLPSLQTTFLRHTYTTSTTAGSGRPSRSHETSSEKKIPSKDEIVPVSKEGTLSGTNDEVAHEDRTAYDPRTTSPLEAKRIAGAESETPGNPLEFSAATPDISLQGRGDRPERGTRRREKTSGGSKSV